ncbi:MAG: ABC transporter permease [Bifidobacteriaceae bacterium]|jgi:ribose transport system permease protein|nr:ABC transporter permease [Bifidobacteriaceae bacterium]
MADAARQANLPSLGADTAAGSEAGLAAAGPGVARDGAGQDDPGAPGSEPPPPLRRRSLSHLAGRYWIVLVFIGLVVALSLMSSAFLTTRNIFNVLNQVAPTGIIACAAALVIIAGGFDLSVGAIYSFAGVLAAIVSNATNNALIGSLAGVGGGLVLGLVNGLAVFFLGINSFIATLATSLAFGGLTEVLTGGYLITVEAPGFNLLGNHRLWTVPLPVYVFAAVALITGLILAKGTFGRHVYAAGGNQEAARLSGVRIERVGVTTFAVSGLCAGLAGLIATSRVNNGQAGSGSGIELTVIAAVVVGGISISGGEGSIWRAVLGVLLIALLGNGFNILNVDPFYQSIAQGSIILIAVAFDSRSGGLLRRYWQRARRALARARA